MSYTESEIMEYIEEEDAKFIRLVFRDAYGIQKNISVMPSEVHKAFAEGIPINAKAIRGFEEYECASLYLKPDPSTMAVLPWRPDSGRVVRMICNLFTADGKPYEADSRNILIKAIETAKEKGIEFKFGSEMEFYLFKLNDEGQPTSEPHDNAGYLDIAPLDRGENIRREICLTIEEMGFTPERSHHESGPGQNEIDFHYGKPLKAADQLTTFKMVVSTIADRYGLYADFSPVPIPDKPGNGYHVNIYAQDKDGNDVSTYIAAGIIDKIKDITLFLNPTEYSYRRFDAHKMLNQVNSSQSGGSEWITVDDGTKANRVELRSPDALCNPYIAYTFLIYAGLYGIENKLSVPDTVDLSGDFLPKTREEAAEYVRESEFVKSILPESIIDSYLNQI
ncbi:MAG: glutamine synthetase [Lachnospiraceae bacterium]|nr:glutamine synthetase [Lachnospiraceae bacterium]